MPKAKAKGLPIRPRPTNPVIAGRVPASLYKKIKQAAKASGRSMSEELAYRVALTFETVPLQAHDYSVGSPEISEAALDRRIETAVEAAVARALSNKKESSS